MREQCRSMFKGSEVNIRQVLCGVKACAEGQHRFKTVR